MINFFKQFKAIYSNQSERVASTRLHLRCKAHTWLIFTVLVIAKLTSCEQNLRVRSKDLSFGCEQIFVAAFQNLPGRGIEAAIVVAIVELRCEEMPEALSNLFRYESKQILKLVVFVRENLRVHFEWCKLSNGEYCTSKWRKMVLE